ncbi:MAG: tetratricopeptide repeat protein [Rhodothermales bacterium]
MKSPLRSLLLVALVAAAAFAGYSLWDAQQAPVADLPEGPREVLPSSEFINAEASIAYYREKLRREPRDVQSRVALAQALLQQANATGREAEYIPAAREALAAALRQEPNNYHALLLQGTLFNKLHRFEDGRDLAERLIAQHPQNAYAHGILADALVELGEYDAAIAASDAMLAIKPSLASYSRASYLRELHGDTDGAIAAMRLAADAGASGHADRAWALYTLGTLYLADAKPDTAAFIFKGILAERPDYAYAVAGLGHAALATGDYERAAEQYRTAHGMAPRAEYLEGLAEALAAAGDERAANKALDGVRKDFAAVRAFGEIVDMEEADFMLDNGIEVEQALEMARQQQARRPGHLHANETYAWALHHNGRSREAIPYIERAMRLDTGDAMVHYRAARIYEAAGDRAEAARHLQLSLANHLRVESPTAAAEAQTVLASLDGAAGTVQQAAIGE